MTDTKTSTPEKDKVKYVAISPDMFQAQNNDDEIDLRELWNVIWHGKWTIIVITTIFAVASVFYALSLPNIYKSEALLAPADSEQQGGLSGLSGQLGGLASLAGVNLGAGKSDKTDLALEILKSRVFFSKFAEKHNILPDLMAVKEWDMPTNTIVYDEDIYSSESDEWVREVRAPRKPKPSMQEAKIEFDKLLELGLKEDSPMVIISIKHYSPVVARDWVNWLISDLNQAMKERDKKEAELNINYLESQINQTNIVEQKSLLYQLIEEQAKTLMFAEVRTEYVFKVIDKAVISEIKSSPRRALIVLLGTILGFITMILILLVKHISNVK